METNRNSKWSFRLFQGMLGLVAMVLPRIQGIRPADMAGGVIPIGPFSGGLLDANTMLMSTLLVIFAGLMTVLRPTQALESTVILGLGPTVWMVITMVLHGPGSIWPIAIAFALGYGALMAMVGTGVVKLVAWLSRAG